MKKLIPFCASLFLTASVFRPLISTAQSYQWAKGIGSSSNEWANSIVTDASGNVYIAGYFNGTADFDPGAGTQNLVSAGGTDIFFAKYTSAGVYQWAKRLGSTGADYGYSIITDGTNIYITGYYTGTVDFDPAGPTQNITALGLSDIFFAKYDCANGNYVWANGVGSATADYGYALALDGTGNLFVTGHFSGTVDFDAGGGVTNVTSSGLTDIFFAKYTSAGAFAWAKQVGSSGTDQGYSIAVDGTNNVYITGYFNGTADFDPNGGTQNLTAVGSEDIYFAKYDNNGNYTWAKNIGSTGSDYGNAIHVNGSDVYVTGYFSGTADFDPGAGTQNLVSGGLTDAFFAKYDASGTYAWAKNIDGSGQDQGRDIQTDASGNVYVTGYFYGTANFDPNGGTQNLTAVGGDDIFLAKYSSAGNYLWAKRFGSTTNDWGNSLATVTGDYVYITGYFSGTTDFDPGAATQNLTPVGGEDIFFAKYFGCSGFTANIGTSSSVSCNGGSNGTANVVVTGGSTPYTYSWTSGSSTTSATGLSATTYSVTVTDGMGCAKTSTVGISQPTAVSLSLSKTDVNCFGGATGTASVTATGGISPYTYSWGAGGSTSSISNLAATSYSVTVRDVNNCSKTGTVTVTQPTAALSASAGSARTVCSGTNTTLGGSPSAAGGTAPYTYLWSPATALNAATIANPVANPTAITVYSVSVTDSKGCAAVSTVSVSSNNPSTAPAGIGVTLNDTICVGSTVTLSVQGGSLGTGAQWVWHSGTTCTGVTIGSGTSITVTPTSSTTYYVKAQGTCNTTACQSKPITVSNFSVTVSKTNVGCSGGSTGTATATPAGGIGPFTYSWSNGQSTSTATGLSASSYTVTVSGKVCVRTATVSITQGSSVTVNAGSDKSICTGKCTTLSGTPAASGGTGPYTYAWSPGTGSASSIAVCPTASGNYTLTVTDANNCKATDTVRVTVNSLPSVTFSGLDSLYCKNAGVDSLFGSPTGGTFSGTGVGGTTFSVTVAGAGTHTVMYTYTDANGCMNNSSQVATVLPDPQPVPICAATVDSSSTYNIIAWDTAGIKNIDTIFVYRDTATNAYGLIGKVPFDSSSYFVDSLRTLYAANGNPNSAAWRYKLAAIDTCGNMSAMSAAHRTIKLSTNNASPCGYILTWTDYSGFTFSYYYIFRDTIGNNTWQLRDSVALGNNLWIDPTCNLPLVTSYKMEIKIPSGGCVIDSSLTFGATRSNSVKPKGTGINDNDLINLVRVYPNPNRGSFFIEFKNAFYPEKVKVKIVDLLGKKLYETSFSSPRPEVHADLPAGVYQLSVEFDRGTVSQKIVVQ